MVYIITLTCRILKHAHLLLLVVHVLLVVQLGLVYPVSQANHVRLALQVTQVDLFHLVVPAVLVLLGYQLLLVDLLVLEDHLAQLVLEILPLLAHPQVLQGLYI